MTDLGTMFVSRAVEDAVKDAVKERVLETVKNALHEGIPIRSISRITGIDEATIRRIRAELNIE